MQGRSGVICQTSRPTHLGHGTQPGRDYTAVCVCVLGGACSHLPLAGVWVPPSVEDLSGTRPSISMLRWTVPAFRSLPGCRLVLCCPGTGHSFLNQHRPRYLSAASCNPPCLPVPRGHCAPSAGTPCRGQGQDTFISLCICQDPRPPVGGRNTGMSGSRSKMSPCVSGPVIPEDKAEGGTKLGKG